MSQLISNLRKIGEEISLFSSNSNPSESNSLMRVLRSVKLQIQTSKGFRMKKPKLILYNVELSDYYPISYNLLNLLIRVAALSTKPVMAKIQPVNKSSDAYIHPVITNPKIELNPSIKELISSTLEGFEKGHLPVLSTEGTGGVYFMNGLTGDGFVSVFKPMDEEPLAVNNPRGQPVSSNGEGLKRGTRVGEGALREVAAYLLDHPLSGPRSTSSADISADISGFAGVMETVMVNLRYPGGTDLKAGSLQRFVGDGIGSCEEMGTGAFSVFEVHKICVLDIRLGNADRHAGNILVRKDGDRYRLVPIDHGYCLPENFEDCTFEWLYWRQAREPFNEETVSYINSLDAELDISILKSYGWDLSIECQRTLLIGTMLLKKGVMRNLTPFQIGSVLCREDFEKESRIEEIVKEVEREVSEGDDMGDFMERISGVMDRYLDGI